MKQSLRSNETSTRITRFCIGVMSFLLLAAAVFLWLWNSGTAPDAYWARAVYLVGAAGLLAGLGTGIYVALLHPAHERRSAWFCPLAAAGLTLAVMLLGYARLGVWPLGEKSVMLVDMHHQYAPLLNELRYRLLHGELSTYSFHIGLGANYLPAFAYYLASPLNLLLVLFPTRLLCEGIWLITLLKFALAAGSFAACAQAVYRRRSGAVIALGMLYAMTGYMLAYSWNVMWLDGVALLPLVVLGLEHMLHTGRFLPYALLLALALYANYYIGFMLCLFLVLYFLHWLLRQPRSAGAFTRACGRFAGASLLAGGLAAFLLVPTALALSRTSAAGGTMPSFDSNFPLFELLGRMFYGASPTIRSGNLPNVYCGVIAVLLLPVSLCDRTVPLRRRLTEGGLLAVLALSCTVNQWDLLWHGLHTPNDLPYRFSFLLCFAVLLVAGRALTRPRRVSVRALLGSLAGCAAYLVLWEKLDGDDLTAERLYGNLLLLALYAALLLFTARKKLPERIGQRLAVMLVAAELLLSSGDALQAMNRSEYFTNHENYVDNAATAATDAALRRAEELAADEGLAFTRMEFLPRSTCMDTALQHYNGMTTFASSNPYGITKFMGQLGYAVNGVNSYLYHSFAAAPDALFGIRYVVLEVRLTNHAQLELVDSVSVGGATRYIYRNRLVLPVAYTASEQALSYVGEDYAPFRCQEQLYSALLGRSVTLYESAPISAAEGSVYDNSITKYNGDERGVFTATVETEGQYFAYVDCSAADSVQVATYTAEGELQDTFSVTPYEPYIIDLGTLTAGEQVEAIIEGDSSLSGHFYVERLLPEELAVCIETLDSGTQVQQAQSTKLSGTLNAREDGAVVFAIPYDAGWQLEIDGQAVETAAVGSLDDGGALLAAEISAGSHSFTLRYRAPGLLPGVLISVASLALLVLWALRVYGCRRSEKMPLPDGAPQPPSAAEVDTPAPVPSALPDAPQPPQESAT